MKIIDGVVEAGEEEEVSGKFVIRIPKSLHKRLIVEAKREGVSLNQYVMYKLAGGFVEEE